MPDPDRPWFPPREGGYFGQPADSDDDGDDPVPPSGPAGTTKAR